MTPITSSTYATAWEAVRTAQADGLAPVILSEEHVGLITNALGMYLHGAQRDIDAARASVEGDESAYRAHVGLLASVQITVDTLRRLAMVLECSPVIVFTEEASLTEPW